MRISFIILLIHFSAIATARTIIVGPNLPVTSLKKAIELAKDKDSILLQRGTYKEGSITVTKSLTIIGQDNPVLDGENKYEIMLLSGKNITIKGITFRNSGYSAMNDFASIKLVDASDVLLENNRIYDSYFAIHISNTSYAIFRNNIITRSPIVEPMTGNSIPLVKYHHAFIKNNHV